MYRIAYCSPLNPQPSGIADYSEELLPFLGQYVEIDVFVDRGVTPSNEDLRRTLPILSLDTLPARQRVQPYAAVVYHMGNSPLHTPIYDILKRVPGVVVLHDWVLHHFKLGYAAAHNTLAAYTAELTQRYGRAGRRAAERMLRGQLTDTVFTMPLNDDVLRAAHGLIGHSQWIVNQASAARPDLITAVVSMGVPTPPIITRERARHRLGLQDHGPIWASFGHINPYKRTESILRAFKSFRAECPTAHYLLVGSVSPNYPLDAVINRLGISDGVTVTGYVPQATFAHYVAAADLCLNLRHPTAGETSASLLRLLGAGRPTLVSAADAFAELPDDICAKVDADRTEADLIYHYAHLLHTTPALASALGDNARSYVERHHSLAQAATGYIAALASMYGWEPPLPVRPPLWTVASEVSIVPDGLPPIATPVSPAMPSAQPVDGLGQALAELGVMEGDTQVLRDVAGVAGELLEDER